MGIYGKTAPSIDIRAVSEEMQPVIEEWFNAEIQIIDPHIETGAFNRVTNTKTRVAPDILWQVGGQTWRPAARRPCQHAQWCSRFPSAQRLTPA